MKTAPLFVLLSLLSYQISYAQTGNSNNKEEQIKKTINNLFYGMKEADSALVASAFSTSAINADDCKRQRWYSGCKYST